MNWEKLGLIFNVSDNFDWMHSHSSLPIALNLKEDIYRIYFSTRDKKNKSHGAFIDINIFQPKKILNISSSPVLNPGKIGLFDDCGVTLSSFSKGKFYYLGWNLLKTVPFSNQIGCAILDNENLYKESILPILSKCEKEPFTYGYPWVIFHNNKYKMWYDVIINWNENSLEKYTSELRYAESKDGINWEKKYNNCIIKKEGEKCISRPCILLEDNIFKIWYSIDFKGKYTIGYSESKDGVSWERKDQDVGITTSNNGWDSDEIEYPFVFDHKGERYMLYNGNNHGKTGIGLATLKKQKFKYES